MLHLLYLHQLTTNPTQKLNSEQEIFEDMQFKEKGCQVLKKNSIFKKGMFGFSRD